MRFTNLASLRRCPVGTRLFVTDIVPPEAAVIRGNAGNSRIPLRSRAARTVVKVGSAAMQLTGDGIPEGKTSYLTFPKASEIVFDESGFTITHEESPDWHVRFDYAQD